MASLPLYIATFAATTITQVADTASGVAEATGPDGVPAEAVTLSPPPHTNPVLGGPDLAAAAGVRAHVDVPLTRAAPTSRRFDVPVGRRAAFRGLIPASYGDGATYPITVRDLTSGRALAPTEWSAFPASELVSIRSAAALAALEASPPAAYAVTFYEATDNLAAWIAGGGGGGGGGGAYAQTVRVEPDYGGGAPAAAAGGRLTLEAGAEHWYKWAGLDGPVAATVSARFERPKGATAAVPGASCVVRYQTGGGTVDLQLRDGADAVVATAAGLASASPALHALAVPAGLARGRLVATLHAAPGAWARLGYYEITWL